MPPFILPHTKRSTANCRDRGASRLLPLGRPARRETASQAGVSYKQVKWMMLDPESKQPAFCFTGEEGHRNCTRQQHSSLGRRTHREIDLHTHTHRPAGNHQNCNTCGVLGWAEVRLPQHDPSSCKERDPSETTKLDDATEYSTKSDALSLSLSFARLSHE